MKIAKTSTDQFIKDVLAKQDIPSLKRMTYIRGWRSYYRIDWHVNVFNFANRDYYFQQMANLKANAEVDDLSTYQAKMIDSINQTYEHANRLFQLNTMFVFK